MANGLLTKKFLFECEFPVILNSRPRIWISTSRGNTYTVGAFRSNRLWNGFKREAWSRLSLAHDTNTKQSILMGWSNSRIERPPHSDFHTRSWSSNVIPPSASGDGGLKSSAWEKRKIKLERAYTCDQWFCETFRVNLFETGSQTERKGRASSGVVPRYTIRKL